MGGLLVFMDAGEGPRAPAVDLTAHHSSLTRVAGGRSRIRRDFPLSVTVKIHSGIRTWVPIQRTLLGTCTLELA